MKQKKLGIFILCAVGLFIILGTQTFASLSFFHNAITGNSTSTIDFGSGNDLYIQTSGGYVGIGTTTPDQTLTVAGGLHTTGSVSFDSDVAFGISNVTKASTDILTTTQVRGSIVSNYGQTATNTLTLPTAAAGYNFIVVVSTAGAGALNIKAGTNDKLYLDGTALDDADKATLTTPAVGNTLTCFTFQTGASAYDWICTSGGGASWSDGGI